MTSTDRAQGSRPQSPGQLFWACSTLALQGFGGVIAVAQRELVERRRWLSAEEFVEDWAVAQVLPGPNVINLAMMLGDRWFGWRGALAAVGGMLGLPLVIVLGLVLVYGAMAGVPAVQGALRGMGAVAAGLVAGAGLRLSPALKGNAMGALACALVLAATFALVAWWRVRVGWVLLLVGVPACLWAWVRLGARLQKGRS